MDDVKDLLDEAVGSYEPQGDQRSVERRVERSRQTRRLTAGVVALAVFAVAGWFAWTAFRPVRSTLGSATESGTYVLSDLEVSAYVDPRTEEVDPELASVSVTTRWSSNEYPGVHMCELQVFDPSGSRIGSLSFEMLSLSQGHPQPMAVPVVGSIDGATATGSCDPERLDASVAVVISNERIADVDGVPSVVYEVALPEGLGRLEVSAQACTSAVWDADGQLLEQAHFTLSGAPEGQQDTGFVVGDHASIGDAVQATVACVPFVREDDFPEPKLPPASSPSTDGAALSVPDVVGLTQAQAMDAFERLGLTVMVASEASDDVAEGLVVSQDPPAGTAVEAGAAVTVFVSEGPASAQGSAVLSVRCPAAGAPEVLTPMVRAQSDGLHVIVDNRSDAVAVLIRQPSRPWLGWSSGSNSLDDEFVLPVPPGESLITCFVRGPSPAPPPGASIQANEDVFRVVDDGGWVSNDLSCGFDDGWAFQAHAPYPAGISSDRPDEAVRTFVPGILPADQVEPAGYPEGVFDEWLMRVVRTDAVVAWVRAVPREAGKSWSFNGYACPNSGIG